LILGLRTFLIVFTLFLVHRLLAWDMLARDFNPSGAIEWRPFLVGVMSDIWISTLFGLVATLFGRGQKLKGLVASLGLGLFLSIPVILHLSYIRFFGYNVLPFHLTYAGDPNFVGSNWTILLSVESFLVAFAGMAVSALSASPVLRIKNLYQYGILVAVVALGLVLHNRNIHYRVQWYVPDNLQTNFLESLYLKVKYSPTHADLTTAEIEELRTYAATSASDLARIVRSPPPGGVPDVALKLKVDIERGVAKGPKPIFVVALMESLRAVDRSTQMQPSLMPVIDSLAQKGLEFAEAYSTGNVTRAAQVAVGCGFPAFLGFSGMREREDLKLTCFPQWFEDMRFKTNTGWYHAGNRLFDGQGRFWLHHGIDKVIAQDDFPKSAPRSTWGVGDIALFERGAKEIEELAQRDGVAMAMILSLTNHIPWGLPNDVPSYVTRLPKGHPSYHTVAYSDYGLGRLVDGLKQAKLWERTILFVIGDHGNLIPPYNVDLSTRGKSVARLETHVRFVLSGGLVEKNFGSLSKDQRLVTYPVSHIDVSATLAWLVGAHETDFFGENLFQAERRWPVATRFSQGLYLPDFDLVVKDSDIADFKRYDIPPVARAAVLRHKAILQLANKR
jgi:phosphoglycerol transferase MdoB-like AlkP superfamily enzyme